MTPSQKRARMRNWAKVLVAGIRANALIIADEYPVTKLEYSSIMNIHTLTEKLIYYWDTNYEEVKKENPI